MTDSTTITISPPERQLTSSRADELTENRENPAYQAASAESSQPAGTVPDKKPLWRRVLITVALLTGVFLVALDVNILGTFIWHYEHRGYVSRQRETEKTVTQLPRHRKSRPSFTASKTRPGTPRRTIWPNWPLNQPSVDCIHLSPSNGHSVGALWYLSLVPSYVPLRQTRLSSYSEELFKAARRLESSPAA
jgi:hypothetical protein